MVAVDGVVDVDINENNQDFSKLKVPELKKYLQDRGIQLTDNVKAKRKAELVDLWCKSRDMKQPKLV